MPTPPPRSLPRPTSAGKARSPPPLARDLANTPHNYLTASTLADLATELAGTAGIEAEVWDLERIRAKRLGGVLTINAGSAGPARVLRLTFIPAGEFTGHLALVGKGIRYDSGGIGLKPTTTHPRK